MASAAYLRVYLPEDDLAGYPEHTAGSRHGDGVMIGDDFAVWQEPDDDDAFVAEVDGRRYICPRTPKLRMLEGLIAFRRAYPGSTASLLVPDLVADRAAEELENLQSTRPGERSHILTSPFYAPLRWFVAFDPADRELIESADGLSIRYRTTQHLARLRMERAITVLEGVGFDDSMVDEVSDVEGWLETFQSDSLVELDYGGAARYFSDGDLVIDETAAEVHASLSALEKGDLEEAGDRYAAAASRWAPIQALTYAN